MRRSWVRFPLWAPFDGGVLGGIPRGAELPQTVVMKETGGDSACWLDAVCDCCGALIDPAETHQCRVPAETATPDADEHQTYPDFS
jgi:hypothetical protein